jgi:hypothetical protein
MNAPLKSQSGSFDAGAPELLSFSFCFANDAAASFRAASALFSADDASTLLEKYQLNS